MADTVVTPFAAALLLCLCAQLEEDGNPVCQCCLRPGTAPPPADQCCDCGDGQGQASVQVTRVFPSVKFPQPGIDGELTECTAIGRAAELTITVYRCVSCPDETSFPSCDELTADSVKILSDMAAMFRAVVCCEWHEDQRIIPGEWRPINPSGCCAGGQMTVLVDLGYSLA